MIDIDIDIYMIWNCYGLCIYEQNILMMMKL